MKTDWAVIFDLDGTIVDTASYHENAWIKAGKKYHLSITKEIYRSKMHAHTNSDIIRTFLGPHADPEMGERLVSDKESFFRASFRNNATPLKGFHEFFKSLNKDGIKCAIASNAPSVNVQMILGELGIVDSLEVIVADNAVTKGKPSPDIFLHTANLLGVPIERCLIFEDSAAGIKSAADSGAKFIVITDTHTNEVLPVEAGQSVMICEDFQDLKLTELAKLFS